MRDVIITARTDGYEIDKSGEILGISTENLQGKIIFKPEPFIDGVCRMHIADKGSILLDKEDDCYTLTIKSSLLKEDFNFCFKITQSETDEGVPIFATKILELQVLDTIEDTAEIPDQYPSWIETFDSKIAQMQALEETVTTNENERKQAETSRNTAENNRTTAENKRIQNETARQESETARATAEATRRTNESNRIVNENSRAEAENNRSNAEETRKTNESERIANETARKLAEENREKTTTEAVNNIKDLSEDYEQLAEEKETELNKIVDTARDFVSAVTFTEIEQNFETGELEVKNAESLGNMNFEFNYETGNLEVGINE